MNGIKTKHHFAKRLQRLTACMLALLCLALCLLSCEARSLPAGDLATTAVGEVNGRTVTYEELYFLTENYKASLGDKANAEALKELVWSNIVQNPIRLTMCAEEGLTYDEKAMKQEITAAIEDQIAANHDGKRKNYLAWLKENAMTDHYYRYLVGVNLLYNRLPDAYLQNGDVPSDTNGMIAYVKENCVYTQHIARFFTDATREQQLAKAEALLEQLNSGTAMGYLLSNSQDPSPEGYLFKGYMEPTYEQAALALEIGEHSGIVEATGVTMNGEESDCFYIILRCAMDENDILQNLEDLRSEACSAVASASYQTYFEQSSFTPNEFALSLDLMNLEAPKDGADPLIIWSTVALSVSVLAIGGVVVAVVLWKRKKLARVTGKKALPAKKKP